MFCISTESAGAEIKLEKCLFLLLFTARKLTFADLAPPKSLVQKKKEENAQTQRVSHNKPPDMLLTSSTTLQWVKEKAEKQEKKKKEKEMKEKQMKEALKAMKSQASQQASHQNGKKGRF